MLKSLKGYLLVATGALLLTSPAQGAGISAVATLDGGNFLQGGTVTNTSVADIMIGVIYTLGTPGAGIATWDTDVAGGTASDFLSNPRWFQTVTFSGLAVAPGDSFSFSGLDIDFIIALAPLDIEEGIIDSTGTTLAHATITALFAAGSVSAPLNEAPWENSQRLELLAANDVPEPRTALLAGLGLVGIGLYSRRLHSRNVAVFL
ncbi:MAG: PEP-CTERM sorting domain-containing protein [Acidobacteriota bacterium]